jgi:very-short-patch-repair endonuclease
MMRRKLTPLSKVLRKNMTDAENKLWKRLNHKQLGVMFRRRYPFEKYIVDFVSFDVKLIIEVDGAEHLGSDKDKQRDEWFISHGFKVLRFWDNEVLNNINGVITEIKKEVESTLRNYIP